MNQSEPKRPYYKPTKKPIVLRMLSVVVKPLRLSDNSVTYELVVNQPQKSSAAKQVIDN